MAKVNHDALARGFSGMIGGMLVFRRVGDETIVQMAPKHRGQWSEAQKHQRGRFQQAITYARIQMADPQAKEAYAFATATRKNLTAYNIALSDFLHAPEIIAIDCAAYHGEPGNSIRIRATDDFCVSEVWVTILNANGAMLESGPAHLQPNRMEWLYRASVANVTLRESRIVVKARDLPGNETVREWGMDNLVAE